MMACDDLGHPVPLTTPARRIVSLVPSLTETVASVDRCLLAGATTWCTHPGDLDVERVRGTKNPDLARIRELAPDLVLANQEENRQVDVEALRAAGIPVWVTVTESLDQALTSLRRLITEALDRPVPSWLDEAGHVWRDPVSRPRRTAVTCVWRDPWIVVGGTTFTADLLSRLGLDNLYAQAESRYPHTTIDEICARRPDLVVLPDEPYAFHPGDGPEALPGQRIALVDGRSLTWYGPSLVSARARIDQALHASGVFG